MSGKVRVYEVAKQLNLEPKAVVGLFQAIGFMDVRNHMSSVDADAVERVKRHLEKQRTHDVVEEKIRPGVIKRRAVAKSGGEPSTSSLPSSPPSSRSLDDVETTRTPVAETNGHHAQNDVLARDRESGRLAALAREATEERKSTRDIPAPAPSTRDRASTRNLRIEDDIPSSPTITEAPPSPPASAPRIEMPEAVAAATPVTQLTPAPISERIEMPASVAPGSGSIHTAPTLVPAAHSEPPAAEAAAPASVPESSQGTSRGSTPPKTGTEYWTGRPGVPMPTPGGRTTSSLPTGNMPRRVQYDPRAQGGTSAPGRQMRTPGTQGGRPMSGRGGPGGRRGPSQGIGSRRTTAIPSPDMAAHKKVIRIEENITLQQMAQKLSVKSTELLMKLLSMGMTNVHINTTLDSDTAKILASEFGWTVEDLAKSEEENIAAARGEEGGEQTEGTISPNQEHRPPVVTVMGHVDHGKTSLLDRIRKANVAAGEAGGITQHIGAYKVQTSHGTVVFLDTPGHEAFTQMRARGASVTDIVILVVAADDGVMPQTREAVSHAKQAKVPILVAVNKIDKPTADPERVKRELVEVGLQPEEWGGDTMFVNVSALSGEGIDALLEGVGLQSEMLELTANPKIAASGTVLEALLDRGRGPVARVLVQDGTLRVGDFVLAGPGFGKVRAMTNEHGKQVHEAGPATPVEILGLSEVPGAGDPLHAVKDPKKAQEIAESRKGKMAKSLIPSTAKVSLEELSKRIADSGQQELRIIIKGDVQGSVEALADALAKLTGEKVRLSIIHAGVGAITEGDINLATAARAIVIGFNVRPAGKASSLAEENKIEIRTYSIIYNAVDDVRGAMEGLLPPTLVEKVNGRAEVRQLFKSKGVTVAGSFVTQGAIKRGGRVRLLRDNVQIWEGKIDALKRFKDDVKDVQEGFECGISLDGYNDIKDKDIIESYDVDEIKQKL